MELGLLTINATQTHLASKTTILAKEKDKTWVETVEKSSNSTSPRRPDPQGRKKTDCR
jgi:hypothetical protein